MTVLYRFLLALHPRRFRERFGDEMLAIYDDARGFRAGARLLGDAAMSVFRRRLFRSEPRPQPAPAGLQLFCLLDDDRPRHSAILNGLLCAAVAFSLLAFAISRGAPRLRSYTGIFGIGGAGLWTGTGPGTLQAGGEPGEALAAEPAATPASFRQALPSPQAAAMQVSPMGALLIATLDRDRDGIISAGEIAAAPALLAATGHGAGGQTLTAPPRSARHSAAAGQRRPAAPLEVSLGFRQRLTAPPAGYTVKLILLDALDTDGDGVLSEAETRNADAVLRRLDRNGDGSLTGEEIFAIRPN